MPATNPASSTRLLSRRAALQRAGAGVIGLTLSGSASLLAAVATPKTSKAAAAPKDPNALVPLHRFPRSVHDYYVRKVRAVEQAANLRRSALRTKADAEAYIREVRAKIAQSFGPFPAKTPLNARVTGVLERDTYRIEKVIFESRPGFPVTANLYVPKGRPFPLPGVVGTCGHSAGGKTGETYQSFAQGLARQGYVTLLFDPVGQGERLQIVDGQLKPRYGNGVREHLHVGNQQFLVGEFFGAWRAWDGIRALDYLLTRPEVDPRLIGVTGNSGGGTDTTWLCGVEARWAMAAEGCFVTTFRRNLENELPADTEQCPPRALALGLDHADFIAALAPKPVILLDQEKDFFDVRGLEEAYGRLRQLYRLLGAEQNIAMFLGPDYHGYSQALRERMYGWFNHVTRVSTASAEPPLTLEKDEALWCTPRGQVAELTPRTIGSFTRETAHALAQKRPAMVGAALARALTEILRLPARSGVPEYRILRPGNGRGYPKKYAATYAVETEPDIPAVVYRLDDQPLLSRPPRGRKRAVLYISHHSADAEMREEHFIAEIVAAEPDAAIFAADVRGIGESQPNTTGSSFLEPYGSDFFYAAHAIMLDEPYAGRRTHDVLRLVDWLQAQGHEDVHLVARGWGAIPATFAAVLHDGVTQVTLRHALTSYRAIVDTDDYAWPLALLVPGILRTLDLPDCYQSLGRKKLRQIDPVGAAGVPLAK
jgi:dienelactone hydrolase